MPMITSLLIANRGEIACRIVRTCRRLGIRAVAVFSDADASALHVRLADEAVRLGPAPAAESYLNVDAILAAARRAEVDAIHPGYGFLAESAAFAQACADAGLLFVGPSAAAIAALGDKHTARELAAQAGVAVLPGYGGAGQSDTALLRAAESLGFPLMVKAVAGGGGVGMRLVEAPEALPEALVAARRAAGQAFGDDALILERALRSPRHVEVQIFGDAHGNLIHLGERECSIQRRHQKVIEESPAPTLAPEQREAIAGAALAFGRAAGYNIAGTVEFLLDGDGSFFFIEINTRLQVEHPVTECLTGLDLVEWQIRVAERQPLPLRQEQLRWSGHAIEARLYAENPAGGFLPASGQVLAWRPPSGDGLRVDGGIANGDTVGVAYDPLLAKIIAHGPDRPSAIRRLARALEATTLLGVQTNAALLRALVAHPAFQSGATGTNFLATQFGEWVEPTVDLPLALIAATLAQWSAQPGAGYWRNNPNRPQLFHYRAASQADPIEVHLTPSRGQDVVQVETGLERGRAFLVTLNERTIDRQSSPWPAHAEQQSTELILTLDGHRQRVVLARSGEEWWVQTRSGVARLRALPLLPIPAPPADAGGSLRAPMPGKVLAVLVAPGQRVATGDALLKLEAMKMEHTIRTAADGVVAAVYFAAGDTVDADALLVRVQSLDNHEEHKGREGHEDSK
jgi:acetyl/propionyl-CoA carboxylase alpha subunit